MIDLMNLWLIGLIVLILIILLIWDWLDEYRKQANFKKIWYNKINFIGEKQLPAEGLSSNEQKAFKKTKK